MLPVQLRILGIILGLFFLAYIILLVRRNKAGVHQVVKWFVLGVLILLGAVFYDFIYPLIGLLGFKVFSNFVFFVIIIILLFFIFSLQLAVVRAEKQITTLTQEVSLLKAEKMKKVLDQYGIKERETEEAGEAGEASEKKTTEKV